jgi:8-oxo-dGTP pyrophosphatase MutT (NUDIX family)
MFVAILAGWREPPAWLAGGAISLVVYATLAYGLGVIVDGTADKLFTWVLKRRMNGLPKDKDSRSKPPLPPELFRRLRVAALLRDDGLAKFMEYQRSRQRIARATTLNLLLLLPIGIWFLLASTHAGVHVIVGFAIADVIGVVVSWLTAEKLRESYEEHLNHLPSLAGPFSWVRAAAVCVRAKSTGVEFLIVRTKEPASLPAHWTFPKGHIEPGESPLEASMREADEEAGARGVVHRDPLPLYLFPAGAALDALVVVPFLMEETELKDPTEPGRDIRWSSPDEAKELLSSNREAPFTDEHDRVIDRALEVIGR